MNKTTQNTKRFIAEPDIKIYEYKLGQIYLNDKELDINHRSSKRYFNRIKDFTIKEIMEKRFIPNGIGTGYWKKLLTKICKDGYYCRRTLEDRRI